MPPAPALLLPPKMFAQAPAAHFRNRPVTQPLPYPTHLPARNQTRSPAHAPAHLTQFVLVKRRMGLGHACAGLTARHWDAVKAFPKSVLVKRSLGPAVFLEAVSASPFRPVSVSWTTPLAQRGHRHWWALGHAATRMRGCRARVAGLLYVARQIILVESFSSPCRAPLVPLCRPWAVVVLNGVEVCRV